MPNPQIHTFGTPEALFEALHEACLDGLENDALVAVPTGSTPLPLYERIRRDSAAGERWGRCRFLQLDEYLNPPAGLESFRDYLARELFEPLEVPPSRRFTIPGDLPPEAAAAHMDEVLSEHGPITLTLLGLGHNGHIAFNEPAEDFASRYHRVRLSELTVRRNLGHLNGAHDIALEALTISVEQILTSRRVFLVVPQPDKQDILDRALGGAVDPRVPASALLRHDAVEVFRNAPG